MKKIALNNGMVVKINDRDFGLVSGRNWYAFKKGHSWYAVGHQRVFACKWKSILMHRLILGAKSGLVVDHINGDGLDNRRSNLRICTQSKNIANKQFRTGKCPYRGIYWRKRNKRWAAKIGYQRRKIHLGSFHTPIQAALAYDRAAVKLFGDFARLNFPHNQVFSRKSISSSGKFYATSPLKDAAL